MDEKTNCVGESREMESLLFSIEFPLIFFYYRIWLVKTNQAYIIYIQNIVDRENRTLKEVT